MCMWHALKGTGFSLELDLDKVLTAIEVFEDCMKDYFLPPEATKISYRIPFSPMPLDSFELPCLNLVATAVADGVAG